MSAMDGARWQVLSAHLDRALDLPLSERQRLVNELRRSEPELAAQLEALLDVDCRMREERFLEESPAPPLESLVEAGQELGAYRLVSPAGTGGMGSVWLAERTDGRFERRAAIKFERVIL